VRRQRASQLRSTRAHLSLFLLPIIIIIVLLLVPFLLLLFVLVLC
jgi:hypothetical protein